MSRSNWVHERYKVKPVVPHSCVVDREDLSIQDPCLRQYINELFAHYMSNEQRQIPSNQALKSAVADIFAYYANLNRLETEKKGQSEHNGYIT